MDLFSTIATFTISICQLTLFHLILRYAVRHLLRILKDDGWYEVRQKGSHKQFKHVSKKGLVTVSYHHLSDDIPKGTLASIYKQAQIES